MILIEKQPKYQPYDQVNFIDMNILQQIIEQAKFTYSPLGKAFEKQIKAIEDQGKKQVGVLENLKPKEEKKPIENKSNNKLKAGIIFDSLIK